MGYMNNNDKIDLDILRKIANKPGTTQRKLSKELGFSLGK
jgi:DNA-binding Lrp family transcriptional regulator